MSTNIGTLVAASIRPVDSLDPIASAFANEIKGGLHGYASISERNSIISERREWGMFVVVYNDSQPNNKTYQLTYGYSSTNINDNLNWKEFSSSGSGSSGSSEWLNSVKSIQYSQVGTPSISDRYLVGLKQSDSISGSIWGLNSPGFISEYNLILNTWDIINPTQGMSVRVDNIPNHIYSYNGVYPTGQWLPGKISQIFDIVLSSTNSIAYSTGTTPSFTNYNKDMIFLTKFTSTNIGTSSLSMNINNIGNINIKKVSEIGPVNLEPSEIKTNIIYSLIYDGINFQLTSPFNKKDDNYIKYHISSSDQVRVEQDEQYWVYGDLTIDGKMINYGHVIIANGDMIIGTSGTFSNYGNLSLIDLGNDVGSSNYIEVTKIELDLLISSSNLKIGSKYKISGVDVGLYGGTDIIVDAILPNRISDSGYGIFYNPKYSQNLPSLNIYDWTGTYNTSADVIWGGKHWICTNDTLPITRPDTFELDTDFWYAFPYDNIEYDKVIDIITYDYVNDFISSREDNSGNIVRCNYEESELLSNNNSLYKPIKYFQWGNDYKFSTGRGLYNNLVNGGFFDCINAKCVSIYNNTLSQSSHIIDNILLEGSYIYSNTLQNSYINSNTLEQGSYIYSNTLQNSSIYSNTLDVNSSIYLNTLQNSSINSNTLQNSSIYSNTLEQSSYIYSNTLQNSSIRNNSIENSSIVSNDILGFGLLERSNIEHNILSNGIISTNSLTQSTIYNNRLNNTSQLSDNQLNSNCSIDSNNLNQVSSIQSNKLLTDSYISNCTLDISSITNNTLTEGTILRSSFNAQSIIDSNNINEGNIDGIQGSSCNIIDNSLSFSQMINISLFDSDISSNSLDSGSNITYSSLRNNSSIDNNVLIINCSFNNNDMTSTSITAISMSASSIEYNLMKNSYFSFTGIKTLSKISKINISDSVINNINIATSSIIYATHSRNVFSRQDGVVKISYYNNSDVLVIGNIND